MAQPFSPAPFTRPDGLADPTTPSALNASPPASEPGSGDPAEPCFHLLVAPAPQLSGDGQLRELITERRARFGDRADLWYVPPAGMGALALGHPDEEAVLAADPAVVNWLQLRFGGRVGPVKLERARLQGIAAELPARGPQASLARG